MTAITIEKAIVHRALSALEYHTQQTRLIHNTELVIEELRAALSAPATAPKQPRPFVPWSKEAEMLESWAAQPATAPAHTEAEASKT
jgi:hypothetical protein